MTAFRVALIRPTSVPTVARTVCWWQRWRAWFLRSQPENIARRQIHHAVTLGRPELVSRAGTRTEQTVTASPSDIVTAAAEPTSLMCLTLTSLTNTCVSA